MQEKLTKISLAAEMLEVSYKTIYNWIELGELEMIHPGYIRMRDAIATKKRLGEKISESRKAASILRLRDEKGRFTFFKD